MSDLPLQKLSVPNKLRLDLYTGVLVPALFKRLHFMIVVCSFVRQGTAGCNAFVRFDVPCNIASSSQIGILDTCNATYDPIAPISVPDEPLPENLDDRQNMRSAPYEKSDHCTIVI